MTDPTLDDLIVLNEEIAAFVKAGIPLELGLKGLSGSVNSRLAELATRMSSRMSQGRKLTDVLAEEGPIVSPVYVAVVEAGLAAGKLPDALQSLTVSTQVLQEIRRRMLLAMIYPAICLCVGYAIFCFFLSVVAPHLIGTVESFSNAWPIQLLRWLMQNRDYFTMVIPSAVISVIIVVMILRKTVARGLGQRYVTLRFLTGRSLDLAQFMEILALQIEYNASLAKAFVLAADSTENRQLQLDARQVHDSLTNGVSLTTALKPVHSLPPLVLWMMANGEKQGMLAETLRQLSEIYRRRTLRKAQIIKIWAPVIMTIVFTVLMGLTYGMAFFIPLRTFLLELLRE
jgi:general secretion pathway protein F